MYCMRRHVTRGRTAFQIGVVSVATLALAGWASAAPLDYAAGNVQPTPIFDADAGANGQWAVPGTTVTASTLGAAPNEYWINPFSFVGETTMSWSGNDLISDLSGTGPYAPGQAAAVFGGGGTFSMTGTLYDAFFSPLYTGLLMAGTVSGFSLFEPAGGADNLQWINKPIISATSGVLVDGTYATMPGGYYFNLTVAGAQQNGGPLVDFQSDVVAIDSMQYVITAVPEPASMLLLLGGAAILLSRRR